MVVFQQPSKQKENKQDKWNHQSNNSLIWRNHLKRDRAWASNERDNNKTITTSTTQHQPHQPHHHHHSRADHQQNDLFDWLATIGAQAERIGDFQGLVHEKRDDIDEPQLQCRRVGSFLMWAMRLHTTLGLKFFVDSFIVSRRVAHTIIKDIRDVFLTRWWNENLSLCFTMAYVFFIRRAQFSKSCFWPICHIPISRLWPASGCRDPSPPNRFFTNHKNAVRRAP